jgi:hypothetical protein
MMAFNYEGGLTTISGCTDAGARLATDIGKPPQARKTAQLFEGGTRFKKPKQTASSCADVPVLAR